MAFDRWFSVQAAAKGIKRVTAGLIVTKRQKRVARMVRKARKHKYDWVDDFVRGIGGQ